MHAVVFHSGGIRVDSVPDPTIRDPDDAIVEVTHAGVCGTDLHLLAHPRGLTNGTILGHEFVGRVVDVGPRVAGLTIGDRVVGADYTACGRCWWCRSGRHWHCPQRRFFGTGSTFGAELPGAQAEYVRVPFADTCLRQLPSTVNSTEALVLGDTLATGYAATEAINVTPGDVVAVIGGGPVGQLAAINAQLVGAGHVIVVEPVADRRSLAAGLGSIAAAPDDARAVIDDLTDGRGADAVVDAVGAPIGVDAGIALARNAATIASVGVPSTEQYELGAAAFARELRLSFAIGNFMRDGDQLISLLASGLVPTEGLLDTGYTLKDSPAAYSAMRERRTSKAVIET